MNTNETRKFDIVAGPSKDMLFDACKYAYNKRVRLLVNFDIAIGYTMPREDVGCVYMSMVISNIRICSIEHEDGSGEHFNLRGYCKADLNSFERKSNLLVYTSYKFVAYYDSKSRKGWITFEE